MTSRACKTAATAIATLPTTRASEVSAPFPPPRLCAACRCWRGMSIQEPSSLPDEHADLIDANPVYQRHSHGSTNLSCHHGSTRNGKPLRSAAWRSPPCHREHNSSPITASEARRSPLHHREHSSSPVTASEARPSPPPPRENYTNSTDFRPYPYPFPNSCGINIEHGRWAHGAYPAQQRQSKAHLCQSCPAAYAPASEPSLRGTARTGQ
jgi:hypothetical protein